MNTIHVLTDRMNTQNSRGFLSPLIVNKRNLINLGFNIKLFSNSTDQKIYNCDVLLVSSKYYGSRWETEKNEIIEELEMFSSRIDAVIYCDLNDSTGLIRVEVLAYVKVYLKGQLLRDRSLYSQSFYGGRIYTDFYHFKNGIEDSDPQYTQPISKDSHLNKLNVSWNMGFADYSTFSNSMAGMFKYIPLTNLMRTPNKFTGPSIDRQTKLFCRFGSSYDRESISFQRSQILKIIGDRVPTDRLSYGKYLKELKGSKIALSPFGWGEFALRDYEAFMSGSLLIKPDMSHLETYPDYYRDGETMIFHSWDLTDLVTKIDWVLDNYKDMVSIAESGQEFYKLHASSQKGRELFCQRFCNIINSALSV